MNIKNLFYTLAIGSALSLFTACSAQAEEYSKDEIEKIVKEYILENPEIIADAIYILQDRAAQQKNNQEADALSDLNSLIYDNALDPIGGNPEGTVTIVEFFDYNCGFCKRASNTLQTLVKRNPNLKVVYKEWPILSEGSAHAARIALAVNLAFPDQYSSFHHKLLSSSSIRTENDVWKVVAKAGLDRKSIEQQLKSPRVSLHLEQVSSLAQKLGITGTPAFIVGDNVLKGAYPIEDIQKAIDMTVAQQK